MGEQVTIGRKITARKGDKGYNATYDSDTEDSKYVPFQPTYDSDTQDSCNITLRDYKSERSSVSVLL